MYLRGNKNHSKTENGQCTNMSADSDLYRLRLNLHETEELIAVFVLRNRKYTLFN